VRRAVFIDKDGTLIENVPYNVDPGKVELMPGAAPALRDLQQAGYATFVVSNQPGIELGLFDVSQLSIVEKRIRELLEEQEVDLHGFYFCPHGSEQRCGCRKPAAGLIMRAAEEHAIALDRSWMIGDILDDIEAGRRAGCRAVLLDHGNETEWRVSAHRVPHAITPNFAAAANFILSHG
jgi:histidinol-phosphate phosphatase family protein